MRVRKEVQDRALRHALRLHGRGQLAAVRQRARPVRANPTCARAVKFPLERDDLAGRAWVFEAAYFVRVTCVLHSAQMAESWEADEQATHATALCLVSDLDGVTILTADYFVGRTGRCELICV